MQHTAARRLEIVAQTGSPQDRGWPSGCGGIIQRQRPIVTSKRGDRPLASSPVCVPKRETRREDHNIAGIDHGRTVLHGILRLIQPHFIPTTNIHAIPFTIPTSMRLRLYDEEGFPFVNAGNNPNSAPIDIAGGVTMASLLARSTHGFGPFLLLLGRRPK